MSGGLATSESQLAKLFVYGTLCPDCSVTMGADQRRRLAIESVVIGAASTLGLLVDLGHYPGFIEVSGSIGPTVHGVLLSLADPLATLAWLDDYEQAGSDPKCEYVRRSAPVTLADGTRHQAWIYILQIVPPHAPPIPSGRWTGRTAR